MYFQAKGNDWAKQVFGRCDLGDNRRLERLIDYAGKQADNPEGSIPAVCKGDDAAQEGAYRFLRNNAVRPSDISNGIFIHTAELMEGDKDYLAIQDSTSISFEHSASLELREQGTPTGFMVHTTLLVDAKESIPVGLIDQERWIREEKSRRPGKKTRAQRDYKDKESYKWESASERIRKRIRPKNNVITVCDREADIYEFLKYQLGLGQRFVVRASHNRYLEPQAERLWSHLSEQPVLGERKVLIEQRGGQREKRGQKARPARQRRVAIVEVRSAQVSLRVPKDFTGQGKDPIQVNAVYVLEPHPPEETEPISWMLLTTESVSSFEEAEKVVEYYACRWLIEEYHKVWKTGCRIEYRALQTLENLERMLAVTSAIAVRIMQLKIFGEEDSDKANCEKVLTQNEWHCLYAIRNPRKKIPKKPPSMKWVYQSIGRLAGWTDTKRTGRIGWQTLWKGWNIFQQHYAGWQTAMAFREMNR